MGPEVLGWRGTWSLIVLVAQLPQSVLLVAASSQPHSLLMDCCSEGLVSAATYCCTSCARGIGKYYY